MTLMTRTMYGALICALLCTPLAYGQEVAPADAWRSLAERIEPGADVTLRLENGQRFNATLIRADSETLIIQPKTRRPVAAQRIGYDAIVSMTRQERHGMGAAKAALIGVAAGAAAAGGVFMLLLAAYSD
jgi:hypothetical protein